MRIIATIVYKRIYDDVESESECHRKIVEEHPFLEQCTLTPENIQGPSITFPNIRPDRMG